MARLIAVHYIFHSRLIDVYRPALEINQEALCFDRYFFSKKLDFSAETPKNDLAEI